jgi:hypothetical protein
MISIAGHERIIVTKSNYLSTIALSADVVANKLKPFWKDEAYL